MLFHHIVFERKLIFHPGDMFENYVSSKSGINTFTFEECSINNRLMDESFDVCEKVDMNIYKTGIENLVPAI